MSSSRDPRRQAGRDRTAKANAARTARAYARAAEVAPIVAELQAAGVSSLNGIARALNERGIRTATGKGKWEAVQVRRVLAASNEILDECVRCGGSVTGEHGIGVEKIDFMPKLFTPEDLAMMVRLRSAFNPDNRCSPHKMLPTAGACIEANRPGRRAAL